MSKRTEVIRRCSAPRSPLSPKALRTGSPLTPVALELAPIHRGHGPGLLHLPRLPAHVPVDVTEESDEPPPLERVQDLVQNLQHRSVQLHLQPLAQPQHSNSTGSSSALHSHMDLRDDSNALTTPTSLSNAASIVDQMTGGASLGRSLECKCNHSTCSCVRSSSNRLPHRSHFSLVLQSQQLGRHGR